MSYFTDVKDFQTAFEQRVGTKPEFPDMEERMLRTKLLYEEFNEYLDAEKNNNLIGVADAIADMIYIACGTAASYGIPLDEIWEEVHNSNMAKLVDGKALKREDGKILKPKGWRPPNLLKLMGGVNQVSVNDEQAI